MTPGKLLRPLAGVVVAMILGACSGLAREPAGRLAYPGAVLTKTDQSVGDANQVTRWYSTPSRPTAAQVFSWYEAHLTAMGYTSVAPPDVIGSTEHPVSELFDPPNGSSNDVDVGVQVVGPLSPDQARTTGGDRPASHRTLRLPVSEIDVTIGN
ncbi:MAG: hypothetical protein ACM3OO_06245 [Planctomycetaceae bacterium]